MPARQKFTSSKTTEDFIEAPPSWLLRWGISVVFAFIFLALLLAWLIKYPDVVVAPAIITSRHPPLPLFAPKDGKLVFLAVENLEKVETAGLIGVFEGAADWKEILSLDSLAAPAISENDFAAALSRKKFLKLGVIQSFLNDFEKEYKEFERRNSLNYQNEKTHNLETQIVQLREVNLSLEKQKKIFENEIAILEKQVVRDQQLRDEGALSERDLETTKRNLHTQQRDFENLTTQILNNSIRIKELEKEILDFSEIQDFDSKENELSVGQAFKNLKTALVSWKTEHLLIAPAQGTISIEQRVKENLFFEKGQQVCKLVFSENDTYAAFANMPFEKSGKVEAGCLARVSLDAFPAAEFGVLKARVREISPVNELAGIELELEFPEGFKTTYGKELNFSRELTGTAEIVTSRRNLLERLFEKIIDVVKNR